MNIKRINLNIIISIIIFIIISILSIYNSLNNSLFYKQILFYILGFILLYTSFKYKDIYIKYSFIIYIIINILLLYLIIFGKSINGSRCWIIIGNFSLQPSEFMKITLILLISKLVSNNSKYLLLKIIIILFIPSILTYLEPDTGVIILYFVITLSILYLYGINKKYIIFFIITCTLIVSIIISLYFINKNILINILGPNIFYRLERLFNFANGTGYQLENSLIVISSSGLFGHGINNIPLYFPESSTDFIFTSYSSIFGLFGNIIFILFILIFNISLISLLKKDLKLIDKYIIIGILGMISYQQFQNISMTIGLLPITGITLPFISYGGSSLFSYMIILGIIFRIIADRKRSIN